ncbi:MAG: sn-glycerol-3-phosphate ABC transporter ATP-binding protein UgpC [Dorea sp.]|uniref:ABC transporter ATP-binding protein n=1 Tax=Sporofaciens sp. JLR.KK001 TaxID=3112621 RepID=UPI00217388DE|nr:sn-glycerol-3-phosphate ABC transporter ATP-binding protein UgpC [Dorea sp.]
MASISFKNVTKTYDGAASPVVPNLNLEIKDKEFIILVGPSGCGKSTTLRMIAGLETITEGEVYIGDRLVNKVPPKDRDIAMVFQNYALYPHMNVYKNISFGLNLRKEDKAEIDRRVHEAAKILDLEHLLTRKPKELSGGQRQRVALGRAMVRNPAVFLLDEPLSNLDAKLRASMRTEIAKLHQKLDITFVYVTHDQTEAMTMGDRIVVMKEGIVQQFDTPQVLYDTPDNLFVAGFIGSPQMNFMDAQIVQEGSNLYAVVKNNKLLVPDFKKKALAPYAGKSVIMGLRLEDFLPKEKMTKDNTLNAEMNFSELMGADYHLHLTVENIPVTVKIPSSEKPLEKGAAKIAANMEKAHFFDKETEKAICH